MGTSYAIKFSFYGFGIEVKCQDIETLRDIQRDYSFFTSDNVTARVFFEILNEAPDYSKFPHAKAYLYTNHNICYKQEGMSLIDYFGKGLVVIDRSKNIYRVFCLEPHLRHEILYLYIMALAGRDLDLRNIHRVHGLGLEVNNKAILILLPSGGGKTTLLLDLLRNGPAKLISEDSPLINAAGRLLPFPIRIGVLPEEKPRDIPDGYLHLVERMGLKPKYMIDMDVFKDKIAKKPLPVRYIFCGVRCLGNESSIKPLSKYETLKELVEDSVVGVGLYQGAEFLIQRGVIGLFRKSPILFSRFKNAVRALSGSKTYSFVIGFDRKKNVETFLNFCQQNINHI